MEYFSQVKEDKNKQKQRMIYMNKKQEMKSGGININIIGTVWLVPYINKGRTFQSHWKQYCG